MTTWSATALDSTQVGNLVETRVLLTDGVSQKLTQSYTYDGSQATLEAMVQQTIAAWSSASKVTPVAKGTVLNTTPAAAPTPTPPNAALAAFAAKYVTHLKYQKGVALGVYLASDPAVVQAQTDAKAAYDSKTPAFFDVLLQ